MKLLVATRSEHKIDEIRAILTDVPDVEVVSLSDVGIEPSPDEDDLEPYDTFEENAESKARYFFRLSGLPTVADDSGIVVDALGGRPGVRSKRFAPIDPAVEGQARDDANNAHLLDQLEGVENLERTARFVCVATLVTSDATPATHIRGEVEGVILHAARGEGGFGYDPLFFDEGLGRAFAELTPEEKNARSHRGRAFRALAQHLREHSLAGADDRDSATS